MSKERSRKWRDDNPEYSKQYYIGHKKQAKQYYIEHKEYIKQYQIAQCRSEYHKQYRKEHSKQQEQWRKEHPEYNKQWNMKHPEYQKQWREDNPERQKVIDIRKVNKRGRNLDFAPLNKSFNGSIAHHLDKTYVVYLPEELHRSVIHCLETGKNIQEINNLAMKFISEGGYDFMSFKYNDIVVIDKPEGTYKAKVNWQENGEVGITYLSPENARGGCSVVQETELRLVSSSAKDEMAERIASIPDDELERAIQSIRGRRFPKPVTARKKTYPGAVKEPKVSFDDLFKQMEENPIK